MSLMAYHNDPTVKAAILDQLRAHYEADELTQGIGWEDGKGCAVGCTLHAYDHALYETRFGIPQMLARLEDRIFEGLEPIDAKEWPLRFMSAIQPGTDLSRVGWRFLHWLLTDLPKTDDDRVNAAVATVTDGLALLAAGEPWPSAADAARAARAAAEAAHAATMGEETWAAADAAAATADGHHDAYRRQADKLIELLNAA